MFPPQAGKMQTRNTTLIPPCTPRGIIAFVLRRMSIDERLSQHWNLTVGSAFQQNFRSPEAGGVRQRSSQGHAPHPLQICSQCRQQKPVSFDIAVTAAGRSGGDVIASSIPLLSHSCHMLPSSPAPPLFVDCWLLFLLPKALPPPTVPSFVAADGVTAPGHSSQRQFRQGGRGG